MASVTDINSISSAATYEKYKDKFTNKDNDLITIDNFYSLLVAEMQNQDPLEPTSNTEFISQMASFTSLQAQQDAFSTQQLMYANSLVGSTVTVSKGDGNTETGVVSFVVSSGDTPQVNINGTNYKLSQISQLHNTASDKNASVITDYGAFASSVLGKSVVVQSVDATGSTYIDEGIADSIEVQDGNVRIVVNGYAYDASDIVRVAEPPAQSAQTVQSYYETDEPQVNEITAQQAASQTAVPSAVYDSDAPEDEPDLTVPDVTGNADLYDLFE